MTAETGHRLNAEAPSTFATDAAIPGPDTAGSVVLFALRRAIFWKVVVGENVKH